MSGGHFGRWRPALALLALLVLSTLAGCGAGAPADEALPRVGHAAPDFELPARDGGAVKLSDYRGQIVVLNFWATWCPPCRLEIPTLKALWNRQPAGLVVVGVNAGERAEKVNDFAESNGMTYPILLDQSMTVLSSYEGKAIPLTLLIDQEGVIRYRRRGVLIPGELDVAIQALLP